MAELDLGRVVRDRLIDQHGFSEMNRIGQIQRIVDEQHALIFEDGQWHRSREGGYRHISPSLKVARRDINELRAYVMDDGWESWFATFDVTKEIGLEWLDRPAGRPKGFPFAGTESQVDSWLDSWMPRFAEQAPRMPLLYKILERAKLKPHKVGAGEWQVWMTAMLDGWADEHEERFLIPKDTALREREDLDEVQLARLRGRVERTRAWIAEHPNGIERELMD